MRPNATMKTLSFLGFAMVLLCAACSGGTDDEPDDFTCSVASRSGTYLVTFTEVSGTCGPLTSQVVRLDPFAPLEPECILTEPTIISPDECSVETSEACKDEFATYSIVGTTRQANADGSLVTGIATIEITDDLGPVCVGTYRLRYERQ
jgi:hypothetical protein